MAEPGSVEMAGVVHHDSDDHDEDAPLIDGGKNPAAAGGGSGSDGEGAGPARRLPKGAVAATWEEYWRISLTAVFLGCSLNVLLVFIPMSMVAVGMKMHQGWIFTFSLLGIAPLAERLGFVTEQLAAFTGPTLGGLLNATFGNATELIISIFALQNGLIRVVQMSLLGSILSNMLLVLGCAFYAGGLRYREQKFNRTAALVNSGLLLMAVMGLTSPAVLHSTHTEVVEKDSELALSRFSSVMMLVAYACYLYFQLKTHSHLYDEDENDSDDDDAEEQVLGFWGAISWMGVITVFISILSEFLVDAIEGAADSWDIPVAFISVIILPIVGNAAEHASAIMFAAKDKVDISLGVAIGSSTQIAMFAIPFCVVVGWAMGVPMDLNFHLFETATLCMTVLVVAALLQEGESNYFKGIMLVLSYLIVAASFYVHNDIEDPDDPIPTAMASIAAPALAP
eukprot:TRINITY_DN28756_c0_g3_i2.p1 TRINITY_DN28756_c0_g3~~TRINITY_DN28756_c0_g3_i2.p1  ORF type:complete len:453 (+),score=41.30 TRINITY_DN28756_c0_g3_i2:58-1416(+)